MNIEHTHSVGKLMLAFTAFWTYIAFSQLLLIWIAGLPEEIPFYITRFNPGWRGIGIFLIFGHFFLPFGALLSRSLKRNPKQLAAVAVWILLVNYIDIYWLVMPKLHPEGVSFHWTHVHRLRRHGSGRGRVRDVPLPRPAPGPGAGSLPLRIPAVQAAMSSHPRHTAARASRQAVRGRGRLLQGHPGRRRVAGHLRVLDGVGRLAAAATRPSR